MTSCESDAGHLAGATKGTVPDMIPEPEQSHPWQMHYQMFRKIQTYFYPRGDEMKTGADVIPDKNLNERLNELEDDLEAEVVRTREAHLRTGEIYIKAQDRQTAFLLLRNERDELKGKS